MLCVVNSRNWLNFERHTKVTSRCFGHTGTVGETCCTLRRLCPNYVGLSNTVHAYATIRTRWRCSWAGPRTFKVLNVRRLGETFESIQIDSRLGASSAVLSGATVGCIRFDGTSDAEEACSACSLASCTCGSSSRFISTCRTNYAARLSSAVGVLSLVALNARALASGRLLVSFDARCASFSTCSRFKITSGAVFASGLLILIGVGPNATRWAAVRCQLESVVCSSNCACFASSLSV